MAASASARWSAMPISRMMRISRAPFPRLPRRFCPAPLHSFAMPRPSAAICCSGRDALISTTPPAPATNAEPGAGCDARDGENRLHAVLGWSEACIATHPSDFCVPLVALDAVVEIEGSNGRREVALEALHRLPGDSPEREIALEPGDLIVAMRLPAEARAFSAHARYLKVRERTSYAFAVVSAAAALRIENGPSGRRGSRSAASPQNRGAPARRKKSWRAAARRGGFSPRRRGGARRRKTFRRQRLQDRAGATDPRARADAGRSRNAGARSRPASLSLLIRFRSASCRLRSSASPKLPPMSGTARISASR